MRFGAAAAAAATVSLLAAALGGCSNDGGGGGSASATPSATGAAASGTVATASSPLGTILVDGGGRTLYLWEADTSSKSTCNGDCATAWPPLTTTAKPVAGKGAQASLLGTTTRDDGRKEITYNGHPLYRYAGDTNAGDTNGQGSNGFGAAWYVLDATGNKITKTPPSPSSSNNGGY
ncbi:hypothetical protein OG345_35635 [Streptomyces sp. NBC_01220]|uniref:COG4315 family predicted lipoprotein n=1 Tax=unclassified Streptomyces TaxID=2593676 RepID=UPI002E28B534|nr:hypothetical protein [Streptomyces sp. NBC_00184]WSQ47943.1 hypothetical protein OG345_35635 [Streptomyces sp. NBC_01220]